MGMHIHSLEHRNFCDVSNLSCVKDQLPHVKDLNMELGTQHLQFICDLKQRCCRSSGGICLSRIFQNFFKKLKMQPNLERRQQDQLPYNCLPMTYE